MQDPPTTLRHARIAMAAALIVLAAVAPTAVGLAAEPPAAETQPATDDDPCIRIYTHPPGVSVSNDPLNDCI